MTSADATRSVGRRLAWDSEFFGVPIGRIDAVALTPPDWAAVVARIGEPYPACIYVIRDANDAITAGTMEDLGAPTIDERKTFERELTGLEPITDFSLRRAVQADLPALRRLAAMAHSNTRFWVDLNFSRARCADLYATWIDKSVNGWADAVFVEGHEGAPLGYVTCKEDAGVAQIGLIAVAESARGRGLGRRLVARALEWAREGGRARASVVTQGTNEAARALYANAGFRLVRDERWHHVWRTSTGVK